MYQKLKPHLITILPLLLMTIAVYGQTLEHDFLSNWDDNIYITQNESVKGVSIAHLRMAFTTVFVGNYAPVQIISYMLDYSIWGMRASVFHLSNMLLHALNGMLLYLLIYRLSGRRAWAFPAAAVFLLHPVQVESVAWLSQRKNLLAMCFFLFSLLSYHNYRQRLSGHTVPHYLLAIAFFCLALLSKSVAVILPVVLLLYDCCCESPPRRTGIWGDKLPFIIAAAAVALLTIFTQSSEMGGGRIEFYGGSPLSTFLTMQTVFIRYLGMLFWPLHLNPLYLPPFKQVIDLEVALAMTLIVLMAVVGVILLRRNRRLFFGYALFFIGLLPVSQIVPLVTLMNDRYLYFPLLGVAWLAGGFTCRMVDMEKAWQRQLTVTICGMLMVGFAVVSFQRAAVWKNAIALWSDAIPKLPDSLEVRAALAEAQINAGMNTEALRTYTELFAFRSYFVEPEMERKSLNNAAVLNMNIGKYDIAYPLLKQLVERFPDYSTGFINLGNCQRMASNPQAAEQAYRTALDLQPGNPRALKALGDISFDSGRLDAAREFYHQLLASGGNGPDLQYSLACLEAKAGHGSVALQHLREALQLGYRNYESITGNPALAPVRQQSTYRQLLLTYFPNTPR